MKFPVKLMIALLVIDVMVMIFYKAAELSVPANQPYYSYLAMQPELWLGLVFSLLQLWTWTSILARTKLSVAYPIASLSYPLTMLAAQWIFSEHLNSYVWLGGFLITVGVTIIGLSKENESPASFEEVRE